MAINKQNKDRFDDQIKYTNNDAKAETLVCTDGSSQTTLVLRIFGNNDLWYHVPNKSISPTHTVHVLKVLDLDPSSTIMENTSEEVLLQINELSNTTLNEVWHQRMGHIG